MNKLLFNEGGQPVYLDDLEMIQSEPLNQTGMLLKALGAGTSMFLRKGIFALRKAPIHNAILASPKAIRKLFIHY